MAVEDDRRGLLEEAVELEDAKAFGDVERGRAFAEPQSNRQFKGASRSFTLAFSNSRGRSGRRLAIISGFLFVSLLLWASWSTAHPSNAGDSDFRWELEDFTADGAMHLPSGYSVRKKPFACHSHNDYWRKVPLFEALYFGCIGVEADVWLQPDGELLVGHEDKSLDANRTFTSLYVNPLAELLDHRGTREGFFEEQPDQTLVLLVDFKTEGHETFPAVSAQLGYLRQRGYLTSANGSKITFGPVTVVASGEAPFDLIAANETYRDIFFDAPLAKIREDSRELVGMRARASLQVQDANAYRLNNSYYASTSFYEIFGWSPWLWGMTRRQKTFLEEQVAAAHNQGLKARYWETPEFPRFLRSKTWRHLLEAGADILNADDLKAVTTFLSKHRGQR